MNSRGRIIDVFEVLLGLILSTAIAILFAVIILMAILAVAKLSSAQTMIGPSQIKGAAPETAQQFFGASGLDFPIISGGSCREMTFSLPGAVPNDTVAPGWPPTLELPLFGNMRVAFADQIVVRLCNISTASVDPAPMPYAARVIRGY